MLFPIRRILAVMHFTIFVRVPWRCGYTFLETDWTLLSVLVMMSRPNKRLPWRTYKSALAVNLCRPSFQFSTVSGNSKEVLTWKNKENFYSRLTGNSLTLQKLRARASILSKISFEANMRKGFHFLGHTASNR